MVGGRSENQVNDHHHSASDGRTFKRRWRLRWAHASVGAFSGGFSSCLPQSSCIVCSSLIGSGLIALKAASIVLDRSRPPPIFSIHGVRL